MGAIINFLQRQEFEASQQREHPQEVPLIPGQTAVRIIANHNQTSPSDIFWEYRCQRDHVIERHLGGIFLGNFQDLPCVYAISFQGNFTRIILPFRVCEIQAILYRAYTRPYLSRFECIFEEVRRKKE